MHYVYCLGYNSIKKKLHINTKKQYLSMFTLYAEVIEAVYDPSNNNNTYHIHIL